MPDSVQSFVRGVLGSTPQISWPLLNERCGCEVFVKHENHLPTGSFKVRGGVWYMEQLRRNNESVSGIVAATRGNHGQSVAFAGTRAGLQVSVVVPEGNSETKNRAMAGLGAQLVEHGRDFQDALDHAGTLARKQDLHLIKPFHPWLVEGVGTYSLEFLEAVADLDTVYVPVGLGSGICGMLAAREMLGSHVEVVGVVAERANTYEKSFRAGKVVEGCFPDTVADGLAVRIPNPDSLATMLEGASRVVSVSDESILQAMKHYFTDTHNIAEGAAASALAALIKEKEIQNGKRIGLVLTGGNVDARIFKRALDS